MSRADPEAAPSKQVYYPCKWVLNERGESIPICMQTENGPCALLALANATLLTAETTIPRGTTRIREDQLMALLAEYVSSRPPPPALSDDDASKMHEHAVADFLDLLPRLRAGMTVNVRFTAPTAFEFTRETAAFENFPRLRLLHGWLVDPQDARLAATLGTLSYNQVADELVRTADDSLPPSVDVAHVVPTAPPPDAFDDVASDTTLPTAPALDDPLPPAPSGERRDSNGGLDGDSPETASIRNLRPVVIDFLESNPTHLTIYGLAELHSTMRDGETGVLFRNSHFYVLRKHAGEIFTLVTDAGFLKELNTVWEKLADVTGDSSFYNGSFQRVQPDGSPPGDAQHTKNDAAFAKALDEAQRQGQSAAMNAPPAAAVARQSTLGGSSATGTRQSSSHMKKKGFKNGCVIQ